MVIPGSAGTRPIAPPVEEMAHVTACAFDGLANVNIRPKNTVGANVLLTIGALHSVQIRSMPAALKTAYFPQCNGKNGNVRKPLARPDGMSILEPWMRMF